MQFESPRIYAVDPHDHLLHARDGIIMPYTWRQQKDDKTLQLMRATHPFQRLDVAISGEALDISGIETCGLLVVTSNPGVVATEKFICDNPHYQTKELARKINTLNEQEIASLGISGLVRVFARRFPKVRGLER